MANKLFSEVTVLGAVASWASKVKPVSKSKAVAIIFLCIKFCKNIKGYLIGCSFCFLCV